MQTSSNPAHALDGGIPSQFQGGNRWPGASDAASESLGVRSQGSVAQMGHKAQKALGSDLNIYF